MCNVLFYKHTVYSVYCRSLKLTESDTVDDIMSECTAALMQEQVDSLLDTDAGIVISTPVLLLLVNFMDFCIYDWSIYILEFHT